MWHDYQAFAGFVPEATAALAEAGAFMRSLSSRRWREGL